MPCDLSPRGLIELFIPRMKERPAARQIAGHPATPTDFANHIQNTAREGDVLSFISYPF
jgi:hypothetical protein